MNLLFSEVDHCIENMQVAYLVALYHECAAEKNIYIYIDSCYNAMDNLTTTCETIKKYHDI